MAAVSTAWADDRWGTPEGQALAKKVVARLVAGRKLDRLVPDRHDGRVDLRGLQIPAPSRRRKFRSRDWAVEVLGDLITFRGARLEGLDLTGAHLQHLRFFGSVLADCRLDQANCRDWRLWDTEVRDCSLAGTSLRGAAVGTWHEGRRNTWRRVGFRRADFRVAAALEALFEDCDFSGATLSGVIFSQCAFTRCRFGGVIRNVMFDGRDLSPDRPAPAQMCQVDFRSAVFEDVDLRGFDLEDVVLPDDQDVRLVRRARCVARRGLAMLEGDSTAAAGMLRADLENRLRGPGDDQEASVFNRRDYQRSGGADLVALAEDVFRRAESERLS